MYFDLDEEGVVGGIVPEREDVLGGPVHVLVGRDVLRFLVLAVDGPRGLYSIAAAPPPQSWRSPGEKSSTGAGAGHESQPV